MNARVRSETSVRQTLLVLLIAAGLFLFADMLNGLTVADSGKQHSTQRIDHYDTEILRNTTTTREYTLQTQVPKAQAKSAQAARDYINNRLHEFRSVGSQSTTTPNTGHKTFKSSVDVYQTDRFISYVVRINQFTGGVNANQFINTFVENKRDNHLVGVTDVIEAEERRQFVRSVKTKLENTLGISGNTDSTFYQSIAGLQIRDMKNFYITQDSITVLFPPYTVAPGAAGVVSVTLTRDTQN